MSDETYGDLVAFLRDRVGEDLLMVARYTEHESEILHGEEWFAELQATTDTRSHEEMHRDAVGRLRQADLAGDLYDDVVRSEIRVTDDGTGINLFVTDRRGAFVWLSPDAEVSVPGFVEACLSRVDAGE